MARGVWESKEVFDAHVQERLVPVLQRTEGGLVGPGQLRTAEAVTLIDA